MLALYVIQWQRRFDFNITVIFILIGITNLAYYYMYQESNPESAMLANKFAYIGEGVKIGDTPVVMPASGGQGTMIFTIVGISLIACAGVLFIVLKKRSSK